CRPSVPQPGWFFSTVRRRIRWCAPWVHRVWAPSKPRCSGRPKLFSICALRPCFLPCRCALCSYLCGSPNGYRVTLPLRYGCNFPSGSRYRAPIGYLWGSRYLLLAIILWPMVTLVERSLATDDGYGWDNYRLLATSSGSGFAGGTTAAQALEHSVKIAIDATLITLIVAILLALLLTHKVNSPMIARGQRFLDTF